MRMSVLKTYPLSGVTSPVGLGGDVGGAEIREGRRKRFRASEAAPRTQGLGDH